MGNLSRAGLSWLLFWLGDLVSRWNDHDVRFTRVGFDIYQWLMAKSVAVQGDGSGPWLPVEAPIE